MRLIIPKNNNNYHLLSLRVKDFTYIITNLHNNPKDRYCFRFTNEVTVKKALTACPGFYS